MKSWAMVVGIDQYPDLAGQDPLHGAVADACDFADWVLDPAGGAVPHDRLHFWTYPAPVAPTPRLQAYLADPAVGRWDNEDSDWGARDGTRPPKASEIVRTIERVGRIAREQAIEAQSDERHRAYVFLAGHGLRAKVNGTLTEETCYIAKDFRVDPGGNMAPGLVPCESLRRSLLANRFHEAILFLDCCRLKFSRLSMTAQPLPDVAGEPLEAYGLAFAAQDGGAAYETTSQPVRGAFSKTLVEGLRNCRDGAASELHVERLRRYVLANIGANAPAAQVPNVTFKPDPHGPLIVTGPPASLPAGAATAPGPVINLGNLPAGTEVILLDGHNDPVPGVGPLIAGSAPITLPPLADGLYQLIVSGTDRYKLFKHPSRTPIDVA